MRGFGRILFGISFAALGAFSIFWRGLSQDWQPLQKWIPGHDQIAIASGVIVLVCGLAILIPRTARIASLALTGAMLLQLLVLWVPRLVVHPGIEGLWESMSENLIYIAGAWTIFSMLPGNSGMLERFANVRVGQVLFALALFPIGLSHFLYLDLTAPLIPSWLPFHVPLAYFTGAAHIAAGAGILLGIGLAATLETVMMGLFTILVWIPIVTSTPGTADNWSEICVSAVCTGAAWLVAESFGRRAWSPMRR